MKIICNSALLEAEEENMLLHYAAQPFQLGGYESLDDIVTSLGTEVVMEEGRCPSWAPDELADVRDFWRFKAQTLEPQARHLNKYHHVRQHYFHALHECELAEREMALWKEMKRIGYYDQQRNRIVLFPEMVDEAVAANSLRNTAPCNEHSDEPVRTFSFYRSTWACLMLTAFVRAVLRAYFCRYSHANRPYQPYIEEPLVEFGVLLYLKSTHSVFCHWTADDIRHMPSCHHLGASIMEQWQDDRKRELIFTFLENYRDDLSLIGLERVYERDAATHLYELIVKLIA